MKRCAAVAMTLLVLSGLAACGASGSNDTLAPTTAAVATTRAPTTGATTTSTSPLAALSAWAASTSGETRELLQHLQAMFAAARSTDYTKLGITCSNLKDWADRVAAEAPAPDEAINTHWQRMIVLSGEMADACLRGATSRNAALIAQATAKADELNDETTAMGDALKDASARAGGN